MGKKGGWISALKKVFTPKSKEKFDTEKRERQGRKRNGEANSFIPLYSEPSSIEKILSDVEKEQQQYKAYQVSAKAGSSDRKAPYKAKSIIPSKQAIRHNSKAITSNHVHISATKIQAAYRGYMARRSYKALKGLLRLKNMMKGQSIKRQTMSTMRSMQLLVRIQAQIHARRLQMMENQSLHQNQIALRSSLSKWNTTNQLEREAYDEWDDSMLTKKEKDADVKRKVEAVMKRERALAYAYSHQLQTITPKTAHAALTIARSGGVPLWWNWLERQVPSVYQSAKTAAPRTPRPSSAATIAGSAHHRSSSRSKPPKTPFDGSTPRLSRTLHAHISSNRWQATHARTALRDDDSLTSCPAFMAPLAASGNSAAEIPNYMAPTVSAKAKLRAASMEGGRGAKEGGRFSFALNQSIGSLRLFSAMKKAAPVVPRAKEVAGRHRSTLSVGELSVDSTVSLPAGLGRRPFK